jgi:hypothetical protein
VTERPGSSGTDPIGEFQQWLVRSGAREVSRGLRGRVRSALGLSDSKMDVWESATTTPPPGEAPECAWCPVCRAARLLRETGPGVGSQVAAAGEVLASVVQDAVSAVEAALAATGRAAAQDGARATWSADTEDGPTGDFGHVPPQDVPAADVPPQEASASGVPPQDASAEDVSPQDASSEDASPQDASAEDASSEDASSEDASSEDASSEDVPPDVPGAAGPPEGSPDEPDDRG